MATILTLGEMVNLALGTPEVGCVNYNVLHTLLHAILAKLHISGAPVQLGQAMAGTQGSSPDHQSLAGSEDWGAWVGSQPSLVNTTDDGGKTDSGTGKKKEGGSGKEKEKAEGVRQGVASEAERGTAGGVEKSAAGKGAHVEKGRRESGKTGGVEASHGRKSPGKGGSPGGNDSVPLIVQSMPFHELAKKVEKLEECWKELNELQKITPFKEAGIDKDVPLHDMWETLQFKKKLDANTEGVDQLMILVEDILRQIQKLSDNDAEQMALISGSHEKIGKLTPKGDLDAVKQELKSVSDRVDGIQPVEDVITWEHLESALKGSSDALEVQGVGRPGDKKPSEGSVERQGSLRDADESELALIRKDEDDEDERGSRRKDGGGGKGGKGGKDGKHSGKESGSSEHPGGKGQKGVAGEGGRKGEMESGNHDGGWITESGRLLDKEGGLDEGGSRRSSGSGKMGPSPDLQTVLGVLGKLDDKFKAMMKKVSGIEKHLEQKDLIKVSPDLMKRMSDSALVIETTREQLRDFTDELSRSYLDQMTNANDIIARLMDLKAECTSLAPAQKEEAPRPIGRKSLALGELEKYMKLIDRTFGVLQRNVENLDCKLTNQTIKWDEKLSSFLLGGSRPDTGLEQHIISSPPLDEEVCSEEEGVSQSAADNQTRLNELEKKLGLRKDDMCKMTKRLNQLNKTISQQLVETKDRLNDLESRLAEMTCDLKRLLQRIEAEKGADGVAPTADVLDGSGVSQLIGVQKALDDLKADMEKLSGKTDSLQQSNSKHQDSIEDLLKFASDLEDKKSDKADFIEKAAKQDLDLKLDSRVFELTCDEITKNVSSLLGRIARLDEECKNSFDRLTSDMNGYMSSEDFDRIRQCMAKQFKVLAKKLAKMQKQLEIAKLVGDDAAGIRRQLFKCLSCDRTILMASNEPKPALSARDGLFPYRSTKPYTTYELEQIRQHARCFQIPKGLSNYERAVIERQLSRFKLRDLRGNANPYWKQEHPCSTTKNTRTSAASPNSQGDASVTPTNDDLSPFPDPYACTRPCGGSHTLTSPYKRVIHMADLNTILTPEDPNQENNIVGSCPTTQFDKSALVSDRQSPVVTARSPVANAEEVEDDQVSVSASQDNLTANASSDDRGYFDSASRPETLAGSNSTPQPPPNASVAAHAILKQISDDTGRRFSDPAVIGLIGKKPDPKKLSANKPQADRRVSSPNTSSSDGATPNSSTHLKKRRFSTPVNMSSRDTSSPSAHLRKHLKAQEVKEEEDNSNSEAEEGKKPKNTRRENGE